MVAQLSCVQRYQQQLGGFLLLDRLLAWLGVSPGGIVSGHVAAKLGPVPLGNSLRLDSNDRSISVVTR